MKQQQLIKGKYNGFIRKQSYLYLFKYQIQKVCGSKLFGTSQIERAYIIGKRSRIEVDKHLEFIFI